MEDFQLTYVHTVGLHNYTAHVAFNWYHMKILARLFTHSQCSVSRPTDNNFTIKLGAPYSSSMAS